MDGGYYCVVITDDDGLCRVGIVGSASCCEGFAETFNGSESVASVPPRSKAEVVELSTADILRATRGGLRLTGPAAVVVTGEDGSRNLAYFGQLPGAYAFAGSFCWPGECAEVVELPADELLDLAMRKSKGIAEPAARRVSGQRSPGLKCPRKAQSRRALAAQR